VTQTSPLFLNHIFVAVSLINIVVASERRCNWMCIVFALPTLIGKKRAVDRKRVFVKRN
jgi:hypothetical protein